MRKISVTEFKKISDEITFAIFIFDSENQPTNDGIVKIVERYDEMVTMLNPNRICFKNKTGVLCLNQVKYILHHNDTDRYGHVFSIVCGNLNDDDNNKTYVIMVDENFKSKL